MGDRVTTNAAVAFTFLHRYVLSVALPVTLFQDGSDPTGNGLVAARSFGPEDLRVQGKALIAGNQTAGIGGSFELTFPTGYGDAFLSSGTVAANVRIFGSLSAGPVKFAVMAGWYFAFSQPPFLNVRGDSALLAGIGMGVKVWRSEQAHRAVELTLEVGGQFDRAFNDWINMPIGLFASSQFLIGSACRLYLGAGMALDHGFREPDIRLMTGFSCAYTISDPPRVARAGPQPPLPQEPIGAAASDEPPLLREVVEPAMAPSAVSPAPPLLQETTPFPGDVNPSSAPGSTGTAIVAPTLRLESSKGATDTPEQAKVRAQLAVDMGEAFTAAKDNPEFAYPAGEDVYLNPRDWDPIKDKDFTKGFRLRAGASAADAIEGAFRGKALVECEMALQLVFARGILKLIGRKAFDRAFGGQGGHRPDLAVGFGDTMPSSRLRTLVEWKTLKERSELLPGDWVYFHNAADYSHLPEPGPWRGENTVFVEKDIKGKPRYSGHGDGVERVSEKDLKQKLFREYNHAGGWEGHIT